MGSDHTGTRRPSSRIFPGGQHGAPGTEASPFSTGFQRSFQDGAGRGPVLFHTLPVPRCPPARRPTLCKLCATAASVPQQRRPPSPLPTRTSERRSGAVSGELGAFSGIPSPLPGDGPHQTGRVSRTQAPAPNLLRRTPNPPSLGPAGPSSCGEISSPCAPCWPVGATSASVGAPGASPGSALSRWAAFCADPWHLAGTDPKARDRP